MNFSKSVLTVVLTIGLLGSGTSLYAHGAGSGESTDRFMVTRHFTGAWDQVDQESQGLTLEVIEQTDGARRSVAYWYTYGADRKTAWYLGIGDLDGDQIVFELYESVNVGFMQDDDPENTPVESIGSMIIIFDSCDTGAVTYETDHAEVGSGSFNIIRVSEVMNTHCSGGISDDMHADARFGEQRMALTPAREGITGSGQATFENSPGHMEFEIEVDGLPDGEYHAYSGSQDRGAFATTDGHGHLKFSSPGEPGRVTMTFDPRGKLIEVYDENGVVLSSFENQFEEDHHHQGNGDDHHNYDCRFGPGMGGGGMGGGGMGGGMHNCVDDGEYIEIETDLINTGVLVNAEGEAEWQMNSNRVEFSVDIKDVPIGSYTLKVAGVTQGIIEAFEMHNGGVYGRIRFRDPESYGREHLDFEPRGQMIEVLQDNIVILEIEFPQQ